VKRLLFLCHTLPYPPDFGVNIRAYHTLRVLAEAFDVTALCFHRKALKDEREVEAARSALEELGEIHAFPIPQDQSRVRWVRDHLVSTLTDRAYTVPTHASRAFRTTLAELLASRSFDLVHLDSLDLAANLALVLSKHSGPVTCAHHNVESDLLRLRADGEGGGVRRAYMRHQADLIEREEARWCPRFALNLVVSPDDGERLRAIAPEARIAVVPNGVDTDAFRPAETLPEAERVVFLGGYSWYPNRDGMEFFAAEVLPLIRERRPGAEIRWVGKAPDDVRSSYRERWGIDMVGYVDDIRPYVHEAACSIVPLRFGGGTRLKILDAWAMGKAVVSTTIGCEGLDTRDGENILVADSARDFADAVVRCLEDPALCARLGAAARATAEETYSWDVIGASLVEDYRRLLSPESSSTSALR
jgi:glycosyltransferase involved in cell wall biosynthesis